MFFVCCSWVSTRKFSYLHDSFKTIRLTTQKYGKALEQQVKIIKYKCGTHASENRLFVFQK